jgi:hypothetical protein
MRRSRGVAAVTLLVGSFIVGTCAYPTEHDSSVHVSITPIQILLRGNDTAATATAWQMNGPADSQPIPNIVFVWSSSNPSVATVDNAGHIVGITSGTVVITAAAANFDKESRAATNTLRVSAPLEVDSVRPKVVRYGEVVSVYGVGVDSIFLAQLSNAQLILHPFGDTAFANGTARRRFWVPPPAHTDSLFFLGISGGQGVLGFVHGDTTRVVERDLYEPDDTVPQPIDLDAPPPFAAVPTLLLYNPALAFELLKRDDKLGADWYHFTRGQTGDLTFVLTAPQIAGTFSTFLTDSLGWNGSTYITGKNGWTFGPSSHACHGLGFTPPEANGDSTIVAFKNLPAGALDAVAIYTVPGRYGLSVWAGYVSELPVDAHEDDNSCNAADLRDTLQSPFRDTLTIENPHDVDWIRFHYTQGGLGSSAQVRVHAFPGVHPDSLKDLDAYVIKVPVPGDPALQVLLADTAAGSEVNRTVSLATGDYYLAVVDFAGTTTHYEVCVGVRPLLGTAFCDTAFPAPPAPGSATAAAPRVKRWPAGRMPLPAPITPSRR